MAVPEPDRGDATGRAILAAALELFLRQGYHGTSMRQIATAAGVVPGAVYNHFDGKEDIYQTLLTEANLYSALGEALQGSVGDTVEGRCCTTAQTAFLPLSAPAVTSFRWSSWTCLNLRPATLHQTQQRPCPRSSLSSVGSSTGGRGPVSLSQCAQTF